ncbi:unnamed protein product, partial [Tenebrio molitor]
SQFFSQTFFNSVIYFLFYACLKNLHENEQNCVGTKSFVINNLLKLFYFDHVPFSKKKTVHPFGRTAKSWPKRIGAGRVATTSPALKLPRFQLISFPESPQRRNWWLWNVSAKRISDVTELD